jgi:hypothetical protein
VAVALAGLAIGALVAAFAWGYFARDPEQRPRRKRP